MTTTPPTTTDDELFLLHIPGDPTPPTFHTIPAPPDPAAAAAWVLAVQARAARGLGAVVGLDLVGRGGLVLADERWAA